ncbi:putative CXXCH cytochrome family protein [Angulomicrobium tetraedrale]|uniref:Putative CXXCH cytochrome family protein n=1 Tax=Ancylobacter tetraedralis TaxID=217068 RepID=A0A839ZD52_9HYPH|nr:tetratricopeptide repeat protein [Ancylobacter tetraedralis]MBB3772713.1 putative CXXCH cytochrome family protein [Ancylobacter tetraedralis]
MNLLRAAAQWLDGTQGAVAGAAFASLMMLAVGWAHGQVVPPPLAPGAVGILSPSAPTGTVGSGACAACHAAETTAWLGSHHAKAMAQPTAETVRGDFNDVRAENHGSTARFFRDGARYMIETEGRDGKNTVFEISNTFGWEPLQQYLVTFPDGRVQALPWAWDTRPAQDGGQRWFHLYPDQPMQATDPLHWTRSLQNWNFMCAECHSTTVTKGYDATADRFHTTFSEISVGCESCHGAGGGHVAWAHAGASPDVAGRGFASVAASRPAPDWAPDPATGSPALGVSRPAGDEVETCARCHSRRGTFSENWHPGRPLTDTHMPALLTPDLFEDDGQMKDEVFNDHSFKQSRMYAKGVVCSDCHDPHSGQLKAPGAAVCGQCHAPERFAATAHTGHPTGPKAPDCISCHMPERTYMVVDRRHDHSFRIPRPDLSVAFGTPNTCNACHADKTAGWAAEAITRWHGPDRKGYQGWTQAMHLARTGNPLAREMLIKLAANPDVPAVARATMIGELQAFVSVASDEAIRKALSDPDPLVRVAALRGLSGQPLETRWRRAAPLLADPSAAVRIEAALRLADQPPASLPAAERTRLEASFAEYEAAQRLNADRPEARSNLGSFFIQRGEPAKAEAELVAGLRLEPGAAPLAVNLADLYRAQGREADAEKVLRRAIEMAPEAGAARHSLGLALIRQKRYDEAVDQLGRAARLDPAQARYAYVYAVALQSTGRAGDSRNIIADALARNPYDAGLVTLALQEALRAGDKARAAPLARRLSDLQPDNADIARLAARLGAH